MKFWGFIGGVAVGAAATLLVSFVSALVRDTPPPPIFSALPTATAQIPSAVDHAVKAHFPIGGTEDDLIAELSEMGFIIKKGTQGLWADYAGGGFACTESFSVTWKAGADRIIEEVSGGYHLSCL